MCEDCIPVVERGNALTRFNLVAHLYADRFDKPTCSEAELGFDTGFGRAGKTLALDGAGGTDFRRILPGEWVRQPVVRCRS